jgi:hypothetical protein
MAIDYLVKLNVDLRPVWHDNPPEINIGINNDIRRVILQDNQTFHYEFMANNHATLTVELLNKTDADTVPDKGLDKAVIIESVSFFDIEDKCFVWQGEYCPEYPESWYSEQAVRPEPLLKNHTYLSWNGKWTLTFDLPVFTWIHRVQNLGWIYG